jgi:hypothetical protein
MPFGFGKKDRDGQGGKGRGRGRRFRLGRRSASFETEPQSIKCICPECGLSIPHQKKVQCFKLKCPRCGSAMTRGFSDEW